MKFSTYLQEQDKGLTDFASARKQAEKKSDSASSMENVALGDHAQPKDFRRAIKAHQHAIVAHETALRLGQGGGDESHQIDMADHQEAKEYHQRKVASLTKLHHTVFGKEL